MRRCALVATSVGLSLVGALSAGCAAPRSVYVGVPSFDSSTRSKAPTGAADSGALAPAIPGRPGVGQDVSMVSGGVTRSYRLHLPLASPAGSRPLVIAFHSGGSSARGLTDDSGLDASADRNGVVVAYPEGIAGRWNTGLPSDIDKTGGVDDVAFIDDLITSVSRAAKIDIMRVTVAGIGDGASMALRYASLHPSVLGVVAFEGGLVAGAHPTTLRAAENVVLVRGDSDPSLPWTGIPAGSASGPQLGISATLSAFLEVDGLTGTKPIVNEVMPDRDPSDATTVVHRVWGPGHGGTTVTLYVLKGGGGPWPGGLGDPKVTPTLGGVTRDLSGASVIIRFALDTKRPA